MKIIHIANFYGPKSGGIKTTLHNLGTGYTNRGHDFTYIVPGVGFYQEKTPHGNRITVPSWSIPLSGESLDPIAKLKVSCSPSLLIA